MKRNQIWLHVAGILLFLAIPVVISPRPASWSGIFSLPAIRDFIADCLMILFFYLNFYYLIPQFLLNRRRLLYWVIIAAALLIIIYLPSVLANLIPWRRNSIPPGPPPEETNYLAIVSHNILLFASVVLFSILLKTQERLYQAELVRDKMKLDNLKEKVNPHFLFNTLNSIYSLALKENSNATASGILKLSGLMRYVVTDSDTDLIALKKELDYIRDYIELQKLRLHKNAELQFSIVGNDEGKMIAPLIMIPFIENAFKHGVNPEMSSLISIKIQINPANLELSATNTKVNSRQRPHEISGKGIDQALSRLNMVYPETHKLIIDESEKEFNVHLSIRFE